MRDGVGYIGQGKNGRKHGNGVEYYKNGDMYAERIRERETGGKIRFRKKKKLSIFSCLN